MPHLLVLADSLAFHGPARGELLTDPRLYPNVAARRLAAVTGEAWEADVVGRMGWTARDAWWALTGDPRVYSVALPRAGAVVLAVGSMDAMAASIPTYLREGIRFVRPGRVRRRVRQAYLRAHPVVVTLTRGRLRILPQAATDHYLTRCVEGIRHFRPDVPVVGVLPAPSDAPSYGRVTSGHAPAVAAARAWGDRAGVPMVDLPAIVLPELRAGRNNPDGMHWGWPCHAAVGEAVAAAVLAAGLPVGGAAYHSEADQPAHDQPAAGAP